MALRESALDTIAAIATAPGEGAIGIVRLSGKEAVKIADKIFQSQNGLPVSKQKSFTASYGHVVSRDSGNQARIVDEAVVLVMLSPKSYTTEDMVEFQIHGGNVVMQEVLALAVREGARLAGPGEFTKRAFLNGRIDLLQAEAVLDLIQAKSEKSRQWASAQLEGSLSKKMVEIKDQLLQILSGLEASIDFPEDDLAPEDYSVIEKKLAVLESQIRELLRGSDMGILAKRGARVALWGRPNTGKSSLMNRLVKHNRVIVAPIPGTTRDVVEQEIQIEGFPVRVLDTAGIQDAANPIEKEGVERSRKAALGAELVLFVLDGSRPFDAEDRGLYREIEDKEKIVIFNKSDLSQKIKLSDIQNLDPALTVVETSCQTEKGIAELEEKIVFWMTKGKAGAADESVISSVRQKDILEKICGAIGGAQTACGSRLSPELVAVDVRLALDQVGALVGEVVTDDLLEVLFSQFCIGK